MFNLQCPKYLPAASCRKPADGSYFSVDKRKAEEESQPSTGNVAYLCGGDPQCVLHDPDIHRCYL